MLNEIEALLVFAAVGTTGEAATRLRITQSAVSKRIAALSAQVGFAVVEPDGRRLRLTPRGAELAARARPLLAELRGLTKPAAEGRVELSLALADSIASSWGPAVVRAAMLRCPEVTIELHAHRSVLVLESVRLGRYDVGLAALAEAAHDLVVEPLATEPMVLVRAGLERRLDRSLPLVTIEPASATWRAIVPSLRAHHPELAASRAIFVESFAAVARMAKAGFGNGLVPLGLVVDLGLPRRAWRPLAHVRRTVALFTRKTVSAQRGYARFRDELAKATKSHVARFDIG